MDQAKNNSTDVDAGAAFDAARGWLGEGKSALQDSCPLCKAPLLQGELLDRAKEVVNDDSQLREQLFGQAITQLGLHDMEEAMETRQQMTEDAERDLLSCVTKLPLEPEAWRHKHTALVRQGAVGRTREALLGLLCGLLLPLQSLIKLLVNPGRGLLKLMLLILREH